MNGKRLAAVLRIRHLQESRARGELALSHRRHRSAEIEERRTWASIDERTTAAIGTRGAPSTGAQRSLLGGRAVVEAAQLAAITQHEATGIAAEMVVETNAVWTIAARRVEGLERLSERITGLERDEEQRKAGNEIDDLVLARFGREPEGPT